LRRPGRRRAARRQFGGALVAGALQIVGLTKRYGSAVALENVSLDIPSDRYVSLLGPSGSGKTVLLRLIAGFEQPDAGAIVLAGRQLDGTPAFNRGIGFVFQNFALFPHLSVYANIAFGLENRALGTPLAKGELRQRVHAMIELVGLAGLEGRGVHQISGGQRQRVALARTLVTEPRLVLLDEPLGALDANLRLRMRGELRRIRSRLGVTFLHVTGSEAEALAMGDKVAVLERGRVGQFDAPDVVFSQPASPGVARSLHCYNLFAGKIEADLFLADGQRFRISSAKRRSAEASYAIRKDMIVIRDARTRPETNEEAIDARYVASEYTGSAFLYFFRRRDGSIVEVENHLSHRAMQNLDVNVDYALTWNSQNALVFG
jgi:ABC-type Fe3+/spermidine/putrescine transport system ATPase subunit